MDDLIELLLCSVCGEEIFRHHPGQISSRISLPSRVPPEELSNIVAQMMAESTTLHEELVQKPAEAATHAHLSARHPFRYRIWERFGWTWVFKRWLVA